MTPRIALPTPRRHLLLACAALAVSLGACARVAPLAGYELGVPLTVDRTAGLVNTYRNEGTGTSINHTLRFGASFESDGVACERCTLAPRLALAISEGRFEADPFRFEDPAAPVPISTRSYDVYSTLSVVALDVPLLADVYEPFYAGGGPWGSWRVSTGFIQTERIIEPEDFTYPGGARERVTRAGDTLGSERLRYGLVASIGGRLSIARDLELRIEPTLRLDLVSLLGADLGLRRSLSPGLALTLATIAVEGDPPPLAALDTPAIASRTTDTPGVLTTPRASIDLRLVADAPLRSTGTLERVELPLPRTVRFDEGSAVVSPALTRERAARMSVDSLARLSPAELQQRAADLVAMRMREHPDARLTLEGGRTTDEPAAIAQERAGAVRAYLVDVWGIDASRIAIARAESSSSTVRMTLAGAPLDPVVTRWVTRSYSAPRIALSHAIDAPAGVRYREIALRQGDRIVARATDDRGDSILTADLDLDGGLQPIVAELTVVDSSGAQLVVSDTLVLREHVEHGAIERERRVVLVESGARPAEQARSIAATIRDGAVVRVLPADGGASEATVRLAGALLSELDRRNVSIASMSIGDGATQSRARSDGGVMVVVEQSYRTP